MGVRTCGTCSACCRWPSIPEISKPAKTPCQHLCKPGHGCEIYDSRPKICADYKCTWLRGAGEELDRPNISKVMIDRRMTQFGHMLVAKSLVLGAAMTRKGMATIKNITRDEKLPCLVLDFDDIERVIGVAGPADLRKEVESKTVDKVIKVGNAQDFISNIVSAAKQGRVMPGVIDGRSS